MSRRHDDMMTVLPETPGSTSPRRHHKYYTSRSLDMHSIPSEKRTEEETPGSTSPRRHHKYHPSRSVDLHSLPSEKRIEEESQARFQSSRTCQSKSANGVAKPKLSKIELFNQCSQSFLEALSTQLENAVFKAGVEILKQGDVGTCMYLLNFGEVDVLAGVDATIVATLGGGSLFGEMAVICKNREAATRTATIKARTYCHCWAIDRPSLLRLLSVYPKDEAVISAEAERRLQDLMRKGIISAAERKAYYRQPSTKVERVSNSVKALAKSHRQCSSEEVGRLSYESAASRHTFEDNDRVSCESMSPRRTYEDPRREFRRDSWDFTDVRLKANKHVLTNDGADSGDAPSSRRFSDSVVGTPRATLENHSMQSESTTRTNYRRQSDSTIFTQSKTACEAAAITKLCKIVSHDGGRYSLKSAPQQSLAGHVLERPAGWATVEPSKPRRLAPLSQGIGHFGETSDAVQRNYRRNSSLPLSGTLNELELLLDCLPSSYDTCPTASEPNL